MPLLDVTAERSRPLPTVVALERLWTEVSTRPLWAKPNFWRYLKLRWRMRIRPVQADRLRLVAPQHKVNDCNSCTEICCVGPRSTVLLRLADIAALIDLERTDLIGAAKPEFSAEERTDHPALARQVQSADWRDFPVLRQDHMGACAALTAAGRCGLYPHWPSSCARFPYALIPDERGSGAQVFYSGRCDSFWIEPPTDPRAAAKVTAMAVAAASAYNQRISDLVLLAYAPTALGELGLLEYLRR